MSSTGLFRDIRNLKRQSSTLSTGQDLIASLKQLKKARSNQNINLNTFMQTKNEKIKNIDQKLQIHESQIERNNRIINDLSSTIVLVKQQFIKQKQRTIIEIKKNKLLKEQIQRTNKLLKAKTFKVEQLIKIKQSLQKQIQQNKAGLQKNQQYVKIITGLRRQLFILEQSIQQTKQKYEEKEKQLLKVKEKYSQNQTFKTKINQLSAQISAKDLIIHSYKTTINQIQFQKQKGISQKNNFEKQIQKMSRQINDFKKNKNSIQKQLIIMQKKLNETNKKLEDIEYQKKNYQSKAKNHQQQQNKIKTQIKQLKNQNQILITKYNQKVTQCNGQNAKLQKSNLKIKELQSKIVQSKDQKNKLGQIQGKFQQFRNKSKNLQNLYNQMVPQIQCPFGHELKQPVTIIPCGHNYCLGCKKGYQKQCFQCKGKLKIEAVYRNQLMDDIINIVGGIRQVINIVK